MFRRPVLYVVLFLLLFLWGCAGAFSGSFRGGERPQLIGEVAYAEPMLFDYNRDGQSKQVQLWFSLDVKPAWGKKGEPGYQEEEGTVRRYLKDLKLGVPVIGYNQFMMLPTNPLGEPVEVRDISISGNTAVFTLGTNRVTVKVNGPGFANNSITVNDGLRDYPMSLFAGGLKIVRQEPAPDTVK